MNTATLTAPTHEEIKHAIVNALPDSGVIPVPVLRAQIPGDWWSQTHALGELEQRGEIYCLKVRGTPLVTRPLFPPSEQTRSYPAMVL